VWPFRSSRFSLVAVSIFPTQARCAYIYNNRIEAAAILPYTALQVIGTRLFNLSALQQFIEHFIKEHKIHNPSVALAIEMQKAESVITTSSTHELPQIPPELAYLEPCIWSFQSIAPQSGSATWYGAAIKREQLFQYQLLVSGLSAPCLIITTHQAPIHIATLCGTTLTTAVPLSDNERLCFAGLSYIGKQMYEHA
jgi:hypothetical protein